MGEAPPMSHLCNTVNEKNSTEGGKKGERGVLSSVSEKTLREKQASVGYARISSPNQRRRAEGGGNIPSILCG